jgi:hypothetical protein
MKKYTLILLIFLLWASAAGAQQATGTKGPDSGEVVSAGFLGPTYDWVKQNGSSRAGEYEYLKSSAGGELRLEYDPLPQRFSLETNYLNQKDYYGELDYAYRDVIVINGISRSIFHNLDHLSFGPDDLTTPSPSFTDLNPTDQYGLQNQMNRAFIRFKTPDFPFHLFADATTVERNGTIQQIFLRGFTGGLDKVSQSRNVDWKTQEIRAGVNSHLGPVEVEYNHAQKTFESVSGNVLFDAYPLFTVPHNEVPDLKSSSDTVKLHTTLTGRIVAAVAYSSGDKKNKDSDVKVGFRNTAGDLTLTPFGGMVLAFRYRHYDRTESGPDTTTLAGLGNTYSVRDAISSKRDVGTGVIRYRLTDRLTVKGEYVVEAIARDTGDSLILSPLQVAPVPVGTAPGFWDVAHRTTKTTEKLGVTYRVMSRLALRADYSAVQVTNPAYANDPDKVNSAKVTATWTPTRQVIALVSYGGTRERRTDLAAPLAGGSRRTDRDQALGSLTFLAGKGSSITASYMYFVNKTRQTLTFTDTAGLFNLESSVPYGDTAQVFSLSASQAVAEGVVLTADASKSFSSGKFRVDGTVPGTTGIETFSDLKVVEDIFTAAAEIQVSRSVGSEVRYQYREYNNKIDSTQNGRVQTTLAMLYMKW